MWTTELIDEPPVAEIGIQSKKHVSDYSMGTTDKSKGMKNQKHDDESTQLCLNTEVNFVSVLCRICGNGTLNPIYLLDDDKYENNEYSLVDRINFCLPVKVINVLKTTSQKINRIFINYYFLF